jgi:hypothetical protein
MKAILMRRARLSVLSAAAVFLAILGAAAVFAALAPVLWEQRLPPLLRNVRAESGQFGACPADNPGNPELSKRLQTQFPPGTPEERLIRTLAEQHFERPVPCKDDKTIRSAKLYQESGLLGGNTRAEIFWKVDLANNLVWTKGFIFYVWL